MSSERRSLRVACFGTAEENRAEAMPARAKGERDLGHRMSCQKYEQQKMKHTMERREAAMAEDGRRKKERAKAGKYRNHTLYPCEKHGMVTYHDETEAKVRAVSFPPTTGLPKSAQPIPSSHISTRKNTIDNAHMPTHSLTMPSIIHPRPTQLTGPHTIRYLHPLASVQSLQTSAVASVAFLSRFRRFFLTR